MGSRKPALTPLPDALLRAAEGKYESKENDMPEVTPDAYASERVFEVKSIALAASGIDISQIP